MKYIQNYKLFLEELNTNKPQGYLDSLSKKPQKFRTTSQEQKPTDEVDTILQQTEEQKKKIVARKDVIEKGLLQNIKNLEPDNQKDVEAQVNDYKNQVVEFDKTVKQIDKLNQTLKKSEKPRRFMPYMQKARQQIKF